MSDPKTTVGTMRSFPISLGVNRAIVQLESGEYICVDTDSLDSINFLIGGRDFVVEPHNREIFRRFLTPNSVVLDIGANFGLYTVASRWITRGRGRIFSFEPNPRAFDILKRSVYANLMFEHPRVTLVNAAVGATPGEANLYYLSDALGGARLMNPSHWHGRSTEVSVPVVSIDSFLPEDLTVDLVKIDVEGFEPYVLMGMEKTIARSPNVRIIMEFMEDMLDETFGAQKFVEYVADLGFSLCRICPGPDLELIEPGRLPTGPTFTNQCFLTRTPEADRARRHYAIPADCLLSPPAFLNQGINRLINDGRLIYEAEQWGGVPHDYFFHGPYVNMPPGRYAVKFHGCLNGVLAVRFAKDFGHVILETLIEDLNVSVTLDLPEPVNYFEIVGLRKPFLARAEIDEITFERQ